VGVQDTKHLMAEAYCPMGYDAVCSGSSSSFRRKVLNWSSRSMNETASSSIPKIRQYVPPKRRRTTELYNFTSHTITNSVALVRERTIPTERPRLSAKLVPTFADRGLWHDQCGGSPTAVISVF
jgi:hypothetical protein